MILGTKNTFKPNQRGTAHGEARYTRSQQDDRIVMSVLLGLNVLTDRQIALIRPGLNTATEITLNTDITLMSAFIENY